MLLEIQAIGNIGKDAEVKEFGSKPFIVFNVAVSKKYTDKDGVKKEKTTWISCVKHINGGSNSLLQYLKKGTQVFIRGDVNVKGYLDKEGNYQSSLECNVREIRLLSARQETAPRQYSTEEERLGTNQYTDLF